MEQPDEVSNEDPRDEPESTPGQNPPEFVPTPEEELGTETHMEAGRIEAVGGKFGLGRADAVSFADFLRRTAGAIFELAQDFALRDGGSVGTLDILPPDFASAKVTFILGPFESVRLDVDRTSPSRDAAGALTDLLESSSQGMLEQVEDLRPESIYAVKRLLTFIKDEDLKVDWIAYKRESVQIDGPKAAANLAALEREGELDAENITVDGQLEMTDAGTSGFKLKLHQGEDRPEVLRRKRKVEGKFSDLVGLHIREKNLWNTDVVATLRVEAEREGTVAVARPPKFELVAVEEAPSRPPPLEVPRAPDLLTESSDLPEDSERGLPRD